MEIAWFRDLVVCIFGLGATVAVVILVVLAFLFYIRIKPILDSLRATMKTVENLSYAVEVEVAGPLAQVAAFFQGIRQAIRLFRGFARDKEED